MNQQAIWGVIIGMALTNFALRFTPIALLSRLELPSWLHRWLSYVPVAIMATLVSGEVLRPGGTWMLTPGSPYLWASVVTGAFYWRFRSFLGATLVGIVAFLALRMVLG